VNRATWQAPDRIPKRQDVQPRRVPVDVAALVRAGHLLEVAPSVYRRAPRPAPPSHNRTEQRAMTDLNTDRQAARDLQEARENALTQALHDLGLTPAPTDPDDPSPHPAD
jgi:hypothetical protein